MLSLWLRTKVITLAASTVYCCCISNNYLQFNIDVAKSKKNIFFHTEFVSYPVDKLNNDQEGQQVDAKTKIFHFQPLGVHAYIQVCIEKIMYLILIKSS